MLWQLFTIIRIKRETRRREEYSKVSLSLSSAIDGVILQMHDENVNCDNLNLPAR